MDIADFDFALPPERIAQHPCRPRDAARLLHVAADGLHDRFVRDLPDLLRSGDILVANDTRVIPAQLAARRGEARIGITLDRPLADGTWHALARNARRLHPGDTLRFDGADDLTAEIRARDPDGGVALAFNLDGAAFADALRRAGALALPPYIDRPAGPTAQDAADYQTVFADHEGAVAAPTAGLHFTPALLDALAARGVVRTTVTLHVGAGTFLPMRDDDIARAHAARRARRDFCPPPPPRSTPAAGRGPRRRGRHHRRCACWNRRPTPDGTILPFAGETAIFILPGHRLSQRRSADDEFPSAALDAVHAGLRLCRHRAHARGLCARDRCGLPLLFVWRCLAAGARMTFA